MDHSERADRLRQIADELESGSRLPRYRDGGGLSAVLAVRLLKKCVELGAFADGRFAPLRAALAGVAETVLSEDNARPASRAYQASIAALAGNNRLIPFTAHPMDALESDKHFGDHCRQLSELIRAEAATIELKGGPLWPTICAVGDLGGAIARVVDDWREAGAHFENKGGVERADWPRNADADQPRMESMAREWTERDRAEAAARGEDPSLVGATSYSEPRGAMLIREFQESFGRLGPGLRQATTALAATATRTDGGETRPAERWSVQAIARLERLRDVGALDLPSATLAPFRFKEWKPHPALLEVARSAADICRELRAMTISANVEPPGSFASSNTHGDPLKHAARASRAVATAFQQYGSAIEQHPPLATATDRTVFDWLREHDETFDLEPCDFTSWSRYVREGRRLAGTPKNSPRSGRGIRSAIPPDQSAAFKAPSHPRG